MKRCLALVACLCLVLQPYMALAETSPIAGADIRLYLADGSLVEGHLVEKDKDLIIMRVEDKIFTFDKSEIDKIITLESLGGGAKNITVTEFPYISFLGGTIAFSLLSWLQFDRASHNAAEADLNREHGQLARAQKLDDKASRSRLYGWTTAVFAVGSMGVALRPQKTTRRVFPELSFRDGEPTLGLSYIYQF